MVSEKIKVYQRILKKYGYKPSGEELASIVRTVDQLARCILEFERKKLNSANKYKIFSKSKEAKLK